MQVLSQRFPGRILICGQGAFGGCGALLAYQESDIYGENSVYCPICRFENKILYNKNYDGTIKKEEKKNDN